MCIKYIINYIFLDENLYIINFKFLLAQYLFLVLNKENFFNYYNLWFKKITDQLVDMQLNLKKVNSM